MSWSQTHRSCPICRAIERPLELLRRDDPAHSLVYACHGCGIVFTQPDRFYAVSKLLSVCDVWCRICGSNAYLVISRPTAAEVVGECQGCGVLYVPRLWLRGLPGRIVRPAQRNPPAPASRSN